MAPQDTHRIMCPASKRRRTRPTPAFDPQDIHRITCPARRTMMDASRGSHPAGHSSNHLSREGGRRKSGYPRRLYRVPRAPHPACRCALSRSAWRWP